MTSTAITGTQSIKIGGTTQLTATATRSDGTTQVVTGQATWTSSDAAVATVNASGLVQSVRDGSVQITATYEGKAGQAGITVNRDVFAIEVKTRTFTARGSCDGPLDPVGEFSVWVLMTVMRTLDSGNTEGNQVLFSTDTYPSADGVLALRERTPLTMNRSFSFDMEPRDGDRVKVQFRATEWDKRIVIIPPSVTDVKDSDMNDAGNTVDHVFSGGAWRSLGRQTIGVGSNNCSVDLEYEISATSK